MAKSALKTTLFSLPLAALCLVSLVACTSPGNDGDDCDTGSTCVEFNTQVDTQVDTQGSITPLPSCSSNALDDDGDGYSFENGASCLVAGNTTANNTSAGNTSAGNTTTENTIAGNTNAESTTGNQVVGSNLPWCLTALSDDDGDGFGFENGTSCAVAGDINANGNFTLEDINHIIVVTGQSNVTAPDTTFDAELDQPNERVFAYTDEGWRVADLHQVWDDNAHPGNFSLTIPERSPNNNFAFHFGKSLAQQRPDAVTAFIIVAAPGKGIAHWDYESPFYLKIRAKVNDALAQLPNRDTVDALLWHQGESDSLYEGTSDPDATGFTDKDSYEYKNYYAIKLRNVIANFRSETWSEGNMPFICGELRVAEPVSRHLLALNDNGDPNSGCVRSSDLPYRLTDPSGAHYSAAGLRELGRRYMQMYLQITGR